METSIMDYLFNEDVDKLNLLFKNRICLPDTFVIRQDNLNTLLERIGYHIPFENLAIIEKKLHSLTYTHLFNKLVINQEGGVCYETNPLVAYFLLKNGIEARCNYATIVNEQREPSINMERTHIFIYIRLGQSEWLADCSFGTKQPLCLVPLCGDIVYSVNGYFRVVPITGAQPFLLERKESSDDKWLACYRFSVNEPVKKLDDLNNVQKIIAHSPQSPFNKKKLVTLLTPEGSKILSENSLTEIVKKRVYRHEFPKGEFYRYLPLMLRHFNQSKDNINHI